MSLSDAEKRLQGVAAELWAVARLLAAGALLAVAASGPGQALAGWASEAP